MAISPLEYNNLAILQAVKMLWFGLDFGQTTMMRPIGESRILWIARKILELNLEPPNKDGFRWWRIRQGGAARLRAAGLNPDNKAKLENENAWDFALANATEWVDTRKERRLAYRHSRRKAQQAAALPPPPRPKAVPPWRKGSDTYSITPVSSAPASASDDAEFSGYSGYDFSRAQQQQYEALKRSGETVIRSY